MNREQARKWFQSHMTSDPMVNEAYVIAIEALKALPSAELPAEAEFADLPDIPRYYYEKVVGNMAHEINMLKEQLESADAVYGEWQRVDEQPYFRKHYHKVCCSVCHKQGSEKYNFCPNCGARMKGGAE